jgi:molybdenum cofactor biosynthesis protein B
VSVTEHHNLAGQTLVRCGIITLSDTRTLETDTSGSKIAQLLRSTGHEVMDHQVIKDEPSLLLPVIQQMLGREEIDVILTTGGTGISRRDQTIGVIEKLIEQPLPGFGELFRMLSFQAIGSAAMLSRAVGGIVGRKAIFAMPGSTAAVELAMTTLVIPELKHLVHQLK